MNEALEDHVAAAIVGIENLHVILVQQGDGWVAQGIELDYAAGGESQDDVKARFERGLIRSIHLHLNEFGDLDRLNVPATGAVLAGLLPAEGTMLFHSVSFHEYEPPEAFPFREISYMIRAEESAVAQ